MSKRLGRLAIGPTLLIAMLCIGGCGVSGHSGSGSQAPASTVAHRSRAGERSFLSLLPACACGRTTVLEQFSLSDGRPLRKLANVPVGQDERVATPSVDRARDVWLTFSSGPQCTSNIAGCGPKPDSCAGRVVRLDVHSGASATVLRSPSSELVGDAVPSPSGRQAVVVGGGCASAFFDEHFVVRDLRSGRQWTIGAGAQACHALSTPAWSGNGRLLVFAYGPSRLSRLSKHARPAPGTCTAPRASRLVIVSAQHRSNASGWKQLAPQRGCSYETATFDRWGVAAVESCGHGASGAPGAVTGTAYLVQLDDRGPIDRRRIVRRLRLEPGWEQGAISAEPSGAVLISQDQPANEGYPERDWVWQFNGRRLVAVAHYRADDAAEVIAVPTAAP